ncbi:hypothetical protein ACZ75_14710 [Massilia sp. NR 4-1]|nr:hypothetical protein ACZ75_14710 [Massilia sp. NR 4-1]
MVETCPFFGSGCELALRVVVSYVKLPLTALPKERFSPLTTALLTGIGLLRLLVYSVSVSIFAVKLYVTISALAGKAIMMLHRTVASRVFIAEVIVISFIVS